MSGASTFAQSSRASRRNAMSVRLLGEEGQETGAIGLRLDVNDGGILGE